MALFGLLGCQGSEEATSVERDTTTVIVTPEPPERSVLTAEEKLIRWIRSCDVREIIFLHGGVTHIRFQGGRIVRLRLDKTAEVKIADIAFAQRCEAFERVSVGIQ
jgi:hypothetical protein